MGPAKRVEMRQIPTHFQQVPQEAAQHLETMLDAQHQTGARQGQRSESPPHPDPVPSTHSPVQWGPSLQAVPLPIPNGTGMQHSPPGSEQE